MESGKEIMNLSKVIDAPLERVWKAWTDPEQLAQWWGPDGFTNRIVGVQPKVGGAMDIDMLGPDGTAYPMRAKFTELIPMEKLSFDGGPGDGKGGLVMQVLQTVTFERQKEKTKLTVRTKLVKIFDPVGEQYLKGASAGWTQQLGRLQEFLSSGKVEKKQPHW